MFVLPILQKKCWGTLHISYGVKDTFYVRILIITRLAGRLITLLPRFTALRGTPFLRHRHPRYAAHFFSDIDNRVEVQKLKQLPPG